MVDDSPLPPPPPPPPSTPEMKREHQDRLRHEQATAGHSDKADNKSGPNLERPDVGRRWSSSIDGIWKKNTAADASIAVSGSSASDSDIAKGLFAQWTGTSQQGRRPPADQRRSRLEDGTDEEKDYIGTHKLTPGFRHSKHRARQEICGKYQLQCNEC
jgi:hypothetical protein